MTSAPSPYVALVAGGLSGSTVDLLLFPLDTVKTRLQAKANTAKGAFFRGLGSAMLASFPTAATFWTVYEGTKAFLGPRVDDTSAVSRAGVHMVAAGVADVFVCAIRNPFEIVKQNMQLGTYSSATVAVRSIVAEGGLAGLFRGYSSMLAREVPFDALQLVLYEAIKHKWGLYTGRDLTLKDNMFLGSVAGALSGALTTPLDVVKTRHMTEAATQPTRSVLETMADIYAQEGFAALWSGLGPRVLWIGIGGAVFLGSFEEYKRRLTAMQDGE